MFCGAALRLEAPIAESGLRAAIWGIVGKGGPIMHLVSELLRGAPSAQSGQDAATRVVVGKRTPIVHLFVSDFSATGASAHNHTWIVGRGAAVKGMFGPVIDFRATLAGSRLIADVGLIVTPDAFFMNAKKALELAE